jgi:hypothetical protein
MLRASTETETIERALDLVILEFERNRIAAEANDHFVESGMEIKHMSDTRPNGVGPVGMLR